MRNSPPAKEQAVQAEVSTDKVWRYETVTGRCKEFLGVEMKDSVYRAKEGHSKRRPGSDFLLTKLILIARERAGWGRQDQLMLWK